MDRPGLIVAPLTPFTSDLKLDEPALRRQIDYVVEDCGATMVVAAGVETQEYTYLSLDERKALIRATVEAAAGRVPVMVGVSHASFKTAVELAHEAERLGAAAVQLLAPLRPFAGSGAACARQPPRSPPPPLRPARAPTAAPTTPPARWAPAPSYAGGDTRALAAGLMAWRGASPRAAGPSIRWASSSLTPVRVA